MQFSYKPKLLYYFASVALVGAAFSRAQVGPPSTEARLLAAQVRTAAVAPGPTPTFVNFTVDPGSKDTIDAVLAIRVWCCH